MPALDCVTGAFGYTGGQISQLLLAEGRLVRTLTNHPRPSEQIEAYPLDFGDPDGLTRSLAGVQTLYNTYWVRYHQGGATYSQAVANSATLVRAAAAAGVERIVHISITKPSYESFYAYYRGKAAVEDAVRAGGVSFAIVRPTVVFGTDDILINNIAWLVRRFPFFAIPGDGRYRLRPVHVADLARLCVRLGAEREDTTVDAVGPEVYEFEELVRAVAKAIGARLRVVHLPPAIVAGLLRVVGVITHDVTLTRPELDGLMAELIHVDTPATCPTRLSEYLAQNATTIGTTYHSELARRTPNPNRSRSALSARSS